MKIKNDVRFPHPVLAEFTNDFPESRVHFKADIREVPDKSQVEISGDFEVSCREIADAIDDRTLACGLFVRCENTYFSDHLSIGRGNWTVEVPTGHLRGTVKLRPVVYVLADQFEIPESRVHEEFHGTDLTLRKHGILCIGPEHEFDAGLEKLVPMESVFRLESSDDVDERLFHVGTESQVIVIRVHPRLYKTLNQIRNISVGKDILLSSLYLPCVMEILEVASTDRREDLRWFRAIESRCKQVGVELDGKDLLWKAQLLLDGPLSKLKDAIEGMSS